jgi:ubiquinol-cytochrome c reductase iron-sulfur subunit
VSPHDGGDGGRLVLASFSVSAVAGAALGVVYWFGGQAQAEGVLLALSLGGIGVGMVAWAKRFLPDEVVAERRGPIGSTEDEIAAFTAAFERGEEAFGRRRMLVRMFGAAFGALAVALVFPIRSLGPRPGRGLFRTAYGPGVRLVTADGRPIRPSDIPAGGVITAWPEGGLGDADASTLVIRVREGDRFGGRVAVGSTVGPVVAYSKLCTHVGCPVGLYQEEEHLLLCPCHQSTFDVLDGARPVFGPATRSLPQLALDLDPDGFLFATGDFDGPVGPGFWDRP